MKEKIAKMKTNKIRLKTIILTVSARRILREKKPKGMIA